MMNRKQRTEEELREASEHLFYEWSMLIRLARGLDSGIFAHGSVINNALIESFTIHARVLLGFLYSDPGQWKKWPEDAVAEDYFLPDLEKWQDARPAKSQILQEAHNRVGGEVAHLTYARLKVTLEAKKWPVVKIARDIEAALAKFLELVPEHLLGPSWDQLKQQERAEKNYSPEGSATDRAPLRYIQAPDLSTSAIPTITISKFREEHPLGGKET